MIDQKLKAATATIAKKWREISGLFTHTSFLGDAGIWEGLTDPPAVGQNFEGQITELHDRCKAANGRRK